MPKVIRIFKKYLSGNEESGGCFKWYVEKMDLSNQAIVKNWELSSPFYKDFEISLGVKFNSGLDFFNVNGLASELFETIINGDCIICSEVDDAFDALAQSIKDDILKIETVSNDTFLY